jgi:hypothetical protein
VWYTTELYHPPMVKHGEQQGWCCLMLRAVVLSLFAWERRLYQHAQAVFEFVPRKLLPRTLGKKMSAKATCRITIVQDLGHLAATMGRGRLVFKGDDPNPQAGGERKKDKKAHKRHKNDNKYKSEADGQGVSSPGPSISPATAISTNPPAAASALAADDALNQIQPPTMAIHEGTGRIITSGTVVTGIDTIFNREINVGDAILVEEEMRVVTMRLSDTSCNLSSSFSTSHANPVPFRYISKPRTKTSVASGASKGLNAADAGSLFGDHNQLVYREKTGSSYRIQRVALPDSETSNITRTNLLEMRAKKKSDKFC